MNAPFTPVDLSAGYGDVSALLKILADPASHKQRLDELVAQEKAAKEQIAALNEMAADTRRLHSTAQAANIVSNRRSAALDDREAKLDERAKSLEQSADKLSAASLQRRENAVQVREESNAREADRLAAMRTDLEGKLDRIKNLTTTL